MWSRASARVRVSNNVGVIPARTLQGFGAVVVVGLCGVAAGGLGAVVAGLVDGRAAVAAGGVPAGFGPSEAAGALAASASMRLINSSVMLNLSFTKTTL